MISGLDFVIYVVCVYITKNFKRVISGLDFVIYVVCIYIIMQGTEIWDSNYQIPMSDKPKRSKIDISHNHNNSISADFRSRFIILIAAEYLHDLPHELRLVIISHIYFLSKKGSSHVEDQTCSVLSSSLQGIVEIKLLQFLLRNSVLLVSLHKPILEGRINNLVCSLQLDCKGGDSLCFRTIIKHCLCFIS